MKSSTYLDSRGPVRTDSRPLAERKASVQMRRVELETQLRAVVAAEAEIDREIEETERAAECSCGPYYDCADHDTDPRRAEAKRAGRPW